MKISRRLIPIALGLLAITATTVGMVLNPDESKADARQHSSDRAAAAHTIFIAGDSIAATWDPSQEWGPQSRGIQGWGQYLGSQMGSTWRIDNRARPSHSAKLFADNGLTQALVTAAGQDDVVLISFGTVEYLLGGEAAQESVFKQYLTDFVNSVRQRQAKPFLITPMEARDFDAQGKARWTHANFPQWVRDVGQSSSVPVFDLSSTSHGWWQNAGKDGTATYFTPDNIHLKAEGATKVAQWIAQQLKNKV